MKDEEIDSRLTKMEIKLAYLEDFLSQIQQVAVEQTKELDILKKENKLITQRLKELSDYYEGDIPNRKPPHY